jgi:hypothetical protein
MANATHIPRQEESLECRFFRYKFMRINNEGSPTENPNNGEFLFLETQREPSVKIPPFLLRTEVDTELRPNDIVLIQMATLDGIHWIRIGDIKFPNRSV